MRTFDSIVTTEWNQFGVIHPLIWQQEMNSLDNKEQIVILWYTEVDKWVANKILSGVEK